MSKTSSSVKNRYNAKAYDAIGVRLPKGTKEIFAALCQENGETMNGLICKWIKAYIEQNGGKL